MLNSRRVVGRSRSYRSSLRPLSYRQRSSRRFESALATSVRPGVQPEMRSWSAKVFAAFALVLVVGALYEFFSGDMFFIDRMEIQGMNYLTSNEIERPSGIGGYNVFFVEPGAVEQKLRKMLEIKSARVATGIPNTVLIQIEERSPEALWLKGNQAYWVDSEGIAFKARASRADLPSVRDLDPGGIKADNKVNFAALNAVRALRAAWPESPMNFEWTTGGGLTAMDEHGWKILFGDASDMDYKIAKLQTLVPALVSQGAKIKLIDLGKGNAYYQ